MAAKLRQILHYLTRWLCLAICAANEVSQMLKTGNFDHELRYLNGQSLKSLFG